MNDVLLEHDELSLAQLSVFSEVTLTLEKREENSSFFEGNKKPHNLFTFPDVEPSIHDLEEGFKGTALFSASPRREKAEEIEDENWQCSKCTFINTLEDPMCAACDHPNGVGDHCWRTGVD